MSSRAGWASPEWPETAYNPDNRSSKNISSCEWICPQSCRCPVHFFVISTMARYSIFRRLSSEFQVVAHHFPKSCFLWGILFSCHKINLQTGKSILHQFEGLHKLWDTPSTESIMTEITVPKTVGGLHHISNQTINLPMYF